MALEPTEFLQDEQDGASSARLGFWVVLCFTLSLIALDAVFPRIIIPGPAFPLLGTTLLALIGWAAGPRIAQYLFPQLGAVASGIGQALNRIEPPIVRDTINDPDALPPPSPVRAGPHVAE